MYCIQALLRHRRVAEHNNIGYRSGWAVGGVRGASRSGWYGEPKSESDESNEVVAQQRNMLHIQGLFQNDVYFHFLYLFNALKELAQ